MQDVQLFVGLANTVILVCGGFVTLLARRAYRRTGALALHALSLGLGIVTIGSLVGGLLYHTTAAGLGDAVAVQSGLSALGFAVLAYSLYADGDVHDADARDGLASR
jgi:hypothetical protein